MHGSSAWKGVVLDLVQESEGQQFLPAGSPVLTSASFAGSAPVIDLTGDDAVVKEEPGIEPHVKIERIQGQDPGLSLGNHVDAPTRNADLVMADAAVGVRELRMAVENQNKTLGMLQELLRQGPGFSPRMNAQEARRQSKLSGKGLKEAQMKFLENHLGRERVGQAAIAPPPAVVAVVRGPQFTGPNRVEEVPRAAVRPVAARNDLPESRGAPALNSGQASNSATSLHRNPQAGNVPNGQRERSDEDLYEEFKAWKATQRSEQNK